MEERRERVEEEERRGSLLAISKTNSPQAASNNRLTTTHCIEPNSGCAVTATQLNGAEVNVTGTSSSINSQGAIESTLRGFGKKAVLTLDKFAATGEGVTAADDTANYLNKVYVTCNESAGEGDACKIVVRNGTYSEYYCTGPYCHIDYLSTKLATRDKANCTGDFCSIKDVMSRSNVYQCSGKNCSMEIQNTEENLYYVATGSTGASITATTTTDIEIETLGNNNYSTIFITNSIYTDGVCRGAQCNSTVTSSTNSRPSCEGFNCTAYGYDVMGTKGVQPTLNAITGKTEDVAYETATKIRCEGEKCNALCSSSNNCTAYCKGVGCTATCFNNTHCDATCEGEGCTTTCRAAAVENTTTTCTQTRLPKKSLCQNCLHAPMIWNWETCRENVTDCKNCYTAYWDLLGLNLYRLGCLDNTTEADVCGINKYIKACYVSTCKDDLCTRTLMNQLINPPAIAAAFSYRHSLFYTGFSAIVVLRCFMFVFDRLLVLLF